MSSYNEAVNAAAYGYRCPTCGSELGERCVSEKTGRDIQPHDSRCLLVRPEEVQAYGYPDPYIPEPRPERPGTKRGGFR